MLTTYFAQNFQLVGARALGFGTGLHFSGPHAFGHQGAREKLEQDGRLAPPTLGKVVGVGSR